MKRPQLSILLLGLALSVAPARATPVIFGDAANPPMLSFESFLHPVTEPDTPEWAKLPHARAWYEFTLGVAQGGVDGMLLVLRGVLCMDQGQFWLVPWVALIPGGSSGNPPADGQTPEPATMALTAAGLAALLLRSRRRRA